MKSGRFYKLRNPRRDVLEIVTLPTSLKGARRGVLGGITKNALGFSHYSETEEATDFFMFIRIFSRGARITDDKTGRVLAQFGLLEIIYKDRVGYLHEDLMMLNKRYQEIKLDLEQGDNDTGNNQNKDSSEEKVET